MTNLLVRKHPGERKSDDLSISATNLTEKTKAADIVIAASVPELIDGSMLPKDTLVIDVGCRPRRLRR